MRYQVIRLHCLMEDEGCNQDLGFYATMDEAMKKVREWTNSGYFTLGNMLVIDHLTRKRYTGRQLDPA